MFQCQQEVTNVFLATPLALLASTLQITAQAASQDMILSDGNALKLSTLDLDLL